MPPYRKFILCCLQVVILACLYPLGSQASQASIARLEVDAALLKNGRLMVQQEILHHTPSPLQWQVSGRPHNVSVIADGTVVEQRDITLSRADNRFEIRGNQLATLWRIEYQVSTQLVRLEERDQIYLPIIEERGQTVEEIRLRFRLPTDATGAGLTGNVYAIGGIGQIVTTEADNRTYSALVSRAGPKAIVTLNAHWPTTVLRLTPTQELRLALSNLEIVPWAVIGLLLPLIAVITLLVLFSRQRIRERVQLSEQSTPPDNLSPLLVGALLDKKVYPQEIAAMIIDLCSRGYIVIVKKSGRYNLSRRKPLDHHLEPWERNILEALFTAADTKVTTEHVQQLNRETLFNPQIRTAFQAIYDVITQKKYFAENPHQTRVRYKLIALVMYFCAVGCAIWVAVTGASTYLLLPVAGTLIVCRLIIAYSTKLVRYTTAGQLARTRWLSFGAYLARATPLPAEAARNHTFERFLAYAVALGCTKEWARRFDLSNVVIVKPDWYISYEESTTTEFVGELESFNRTVAALLAEMRGPLVR